MNIKTKYEIGQHVFVVYEANKEVSVYDDYIGWVSVDKDGLVYGLDESCNDIKEEDIILYDEDEKLIQKIKETMEQIRKREAKEMEK